MKHLGPYQINEEEYDIIRDLRATGASQWEIDQALKAYRENERAWKRAEKAAKKKWNDPTFLVQKEIQIEDIEKRDEHSKSVLDMLENSAKRIAKKLPDKFTIKTWSRLKKGNVPGYGWGTYKFTIKSKDTGKTAEILLKGNFVSLFLAKFGKKKQMTNWQGTLKIDGKKVKNWEVIGYNRDKTLLSTDLSPFPQEQRSIMMKTIFNHITDVPEGYNTWML